MKEPKIFKDNTETDASVLKSITLNDNLTETKNLVTDNGLTPNFDIKNQMSQAVNLEAKSIWYSVDPNTSDANTIRLKKHPSQEVFQLPHYREGISLFFQALKDNTSNEVTIAIDNLEAKKAFFYDESVSLFKVASRSDIKLGYTYIIRYLATLDSNNGGFHCQLAAHNENGNNVVTMAKMTALMESMQTKLDNLNAKIDKHKPPVGQIIYVVKDAVHLGYLKLDGKQYLQTDYPDLFTYIFNEEPERRRSFNVWNFRGGVFRMRTIKGDEITKTDYAAGDKLPEEFYTVYDDHDLDVVRPYGHLQKDKIRDHKHSVRAKGLSISAGEYSVHSASLSGFEGSANTTQGIRPTYQGYTDPTSSPEALLDYGLDETRMANFAVDALIYAGRYRGIDD